MGVVDKLSADDLNEAGVDRHLRAIAGIIRESIDTLDGDLDAKRFLLNELADKLDELDGEDVFGTEGWLHRCGLD